MPKNLWNDDDVRGLSPLDLLAYRSRLLAADRSVVNIFGGNTSVKAVETDHLGRAINVLWVKGSGADMANCTGKDFAGLKLDEVLPLMQRDEMSDEEMVAYLTRCQFEPNRPRQSIETLLHAFTPHTHVDHTHPDAIIALACAERGEAAAREVFGDDMVWAPYLRPGFELSKRIGTLLRTHPEATCVIMGKHGLITWGEDAKSSYLSTIAHIQRAEDALREAEKRVFGLSRVNEALEKLTLSIAKHTREAVAAAVMPVLRGAVTAHRKAIVTFDDSEDVLRFLTRHDAEALSQVGAACPDHLVHTKRVPLFVTWDGHDVDALKQSLRDGVAQYATRYAEYFNRFNTDPNVKMADPAPRVILVPGLGMFNTGRDAMQADVSRQLYHRAIAVMELCTRVDQFTSLDEKDSFDIEYWPLELYKLTLRPPDRELAGRVALVTGAASGIGRAIARRLAQEGAHVVIADINLAGAQEVATELVKTHGLKRAVAVACNVTSEAEVSAAFALTCREYGGVDIVVNNAGIATSAPIEDTTLADWNRNMDILATGYFLVAREAFRVLKQQGRGGSIVFICSKNSVYAGRNASAYSAAKAAELHLARCLAEEGGASGIRVNSVLPDAVLQGSGIWSSRWREERARNYGIRPEELEAYYAARTTLKVNVFPEDVAEAVLFFASDRALKTTGAMLTVDGGVAAAYSR
ncbi:MAG: bifunctional aldolase/short-chain dehydrogenase [Anaerolineae bacterium]|nr:bifunctional aldolase/short-chain dehydrogenase [Anaerolineae bacterium]